MIWPLLTYFVLVVVLAAAVLFVSYLLGQRHSEPATGEPYEGGIVSEGSARVRFSVRYYLVAMFFVIFDLEAVFVYAWAGAVRELGWAGYCVDSAVHWAASRGPGLSLESGRARLVAGAAPFKVRIYAVVTNQAGRYGFSSNPRL